LEGFSGNLYGTGSAEIWRCDICNAGGDWNNIVGDGPPVVSDGSGFGDALITSINKLISFGSNIYAGTNRQINGGQVWRSSSGNAGSWTNIIGTGGDAVLSGGFGNASNGSIISGYVSNDYLYFGTNNTTTGTEIWSTIDGTDWDQSNDDGFGDAFNTAAFSMEEFDNHLYIGTQNNNNGGELWQLNYIPEGSTITASQSDDGDGKVTISFPVDDEDRDNIQAQIQYNIGSGWQDPTLIGSETSATMEIQVLIMMLLHIK